MKITKDFVNSPSAAFDLKNTIDSSKIPAGGAEKIVSDLSDPSHGIVAYSVELRSMRSYLENTSSPHESIIGKMNAGNRLSTLEKGYLRENNPSLHQKALMIDSERDAYRVSAYACKTKADVRRLRSKKASEFSIALGGIQRSSLSSQEKNDQLEFIRMRSAAIEAEHRQFKRSSRYINLPQEKKTGVTRK